MSGTRIQVNLETAVDAALINPSRYNQIKIAVDAAHGLSQSQAVGTEGSGRGEGVVGGGKGGWEGEMEMESHQLPAEESL